LADRGITTHSEFATLDQIVTIILIIFGSGAVVALSIIAWLASATFKSMKMKEKRQEQELNASLLQMNEKGKDTLGELMKIRADLQNLKQQVQKLADANPQFANSQFAASVGAAPLAPAGRTRSASTQEVQARELREQSNS